MPRSQDFSQSVIYHIRTLETKEVIYVGSTTNYEVRKRSHKNVSKNINDKHYNTPLYCYIRNNGGFDYFEVVPVSFMKLETKIQLLIEEQKEIDKFSFLLNKYVSLPSIQHLKELKRKDNKKYMENHREKISELKKKYYEEHKDEITKKVKLWRGNNKDKIYEKFQCPKCKCLTSKNHLKRHQKSDKCLNYVSLA